MRTDRTTTKELLGSAALMLAVFAIGTLLCTLLMGCSLSSVRGEDGSRQVDLSILQLRATVSNIDAQNTTLVGVSVDTVGESGLPRFQLGFVKSVQNSTPVCGEGACNTPSVLTRTSVVESGALDDVYAVGAASTTIEE